MKITLENEIFSYECFGIFFIHFWRSFKLCSSFSILTISIFVHSIFNPKFKAFGQYLVGDIIPYYDSTHKIRKKYFRMKLSHLGTTMRPTICKDLNFLGMGFLRMGIDEYVKETKFVFPFLLLRSRFSRCISLC